MPKLYPGPLPIPGKHLLLLLAPILLTHSLLAQPKISSFTPSSGPVGTTVTISGQNFSPVAANDVVYFGAVKAAVSSATTSSITVSVPAGASYQPITVTTGGLTAYSAHPFIVTFGGRGPSFASDSFSAPTSTSSMGITNTLANALVGDLNGDGKPDAVVLYGPGGGSNFFVFPNSTTGGTLSFGINSTFGMTGAAGPGAIADMDGDGLPDVVLNGAFPSTVSVYKNTSTSSITNFQAGTSYPTGATALYPVSNAVADLDGDGKPDLIVANNDTTITIYRNNSTSGTISFTSMQNYIIYSGSKSIAAGDIDGDGKPDVVVTSSDYGKVSVFKNTSSAGAISLASKVDFTATSSPNQLAVGDLDGDGKVDVAVTDANQKKLLLFRNTGTGGSITLSADSVYSTGSYNPTGVAIGDIDGDGKPDLAVSTTDLGTLNMTQQYPVVAYKNASVPGSLSFAPGVGYPAGYSVFSIALNDMNGDGKPDMIVADPAGHTFHVLVNKIPQPQPPHITLFTPTSAGTGTSVLIHGTSLTNITSVKFGNVSAQSFSVLSDTLISAVVGSGASGLVTVAGADGQDSLTGFTFLNATYWPSIHSFAPTSAATGTVVTITGTHFTGTTSVSFGRTAAASFTVVSDTTIQATVGSGASGLVTVITTAGQDSIAGFTYIPPQTAPHLNGFSPTGAATGQTVWIYGSSLTGITSVTFGNVPAQSFSIVSDTLISAVVGTGASGFIRVSGPNGMDSLAGFIFPDSANAPTIASFAPTSGGPGTLVTITGTHFTGATSVGFGGTGAASFTVVSDTLIQATVGYGASGNVTVTTPDGQGSAAGFTYIPPPPPPHLFSLSPDSAGTGQTVQIYGAYLNGITSVTFGNVAAQSFSIISDSLITAVVGTGASGNVVVTGPNGMDSLTGFIFIDSAARMSTQAQIQPTLSGYPNPGFGSITVPLPSTTKQSQFTLVDMNGAVVKTIPVSRNVVQMTIPLTGLIKGVYKLIWSDGVNYSFQTILVLR